MNTYCILCKTEKVTEGIYELLGQESDSDDER